MKSLEARLVQMIADVRELNARFTDEGQRSERRRRQSLLDGQMAKQPAHMNPTLLVKTEPDET
jgi:hypothetical protein